MCSPCCDPDPARKQINGKRARWEFLALVKVKVSRYVVKLWKTGSSGVREAKGTSVSCLVTSGTGMDGYLTVFAFKKWHSIFRGKLQWISCSGCKTFNTTSACMRTMEVQPATDSLAWMKDCFKFAFEQTSGWWERPKMMGYLFNTHLLDMHCLSDPCPTHYLGGDRTSTAARHQEAIKTLHGRWIKGTKTTGSHQNLTKSLP